MNKQYTLSNGVVVHTSNRARSGYFGTCISEGWITENPFICAISNPETHLMEYHPAPLATALHLGTYADAREASYVASLFNSMDDEGKIFMMQTVKEKGMYHSVDWGFPADLYDLPVFMNSIAAIEYVRNKKTEKKISKIVDSGGEYLSMTAVLRIVKKTAKNLRYSVGLTDKVIARAGRFAKFKTQEEVESFVRSI